MLGYRKDTKVTIDHYMKAREEEEIKARLLELRKKSRTLIQKENYNVKNRAISK